MNGQKRVIFAVMILFLRILGIEELSSVFDTLGAETESVKGHDFNVAHFYFNNISMSNLF